MATAGEPKEGLLKLQSFEASALMRKSRKRQSKEIPKSQKRGLPNLPAGLKWIPLALIKDGEWIETPRGRIKGYLWLKQMASKIQRSDGFVTIQRHKKTGELILFVDMKDGDSI